jgi:hypothetical protein
LQDCTSNRKRLSGPSEDNSVSHIHLSRARLAEAGEIANHWAERGYINAKHLLMLEEAGMADVAKILPRWAPSKREARRETMRRVFEE